jgi:NADH-ubiquinone oxidoreductase chain 5
MLALLMNRGGDFFLSLGFFTIFALFGSLDFSTIYSLTPYINETGITIVALFLFAGSIAKSANLPLSS